MASAVSGVSDAGLRMVVQPAAIAGPSLRVAMAAGKFHGVTRSDTHHRLVDRDDPLVACGAVIKAPSLRTASPEYHLKNSAA